jgi:hypothetical protein
VLAAGWVADGVLTAGFGLQCGGLNLQPLPCFHAGLVDGWRAVGRMPSEAMFRAAFMATSRLGLPADEAAAAMLQLLRESFEVGARCRPLRRAASSSVLLRSLQAAAAANLCKLAAVWGWYQLSPGACNRK